jgi:hypothetical protein
MTDKAFYQAAAAEVAGGQIDQALWIKVTADLAGSDNLTRQAKYIQLRAQELAIGAAKEKVVGAGKSARRLGKKVVKWGLIVAAVWIVLGSISMIYDKHLVYITSIAGINAGVAKINAASAAIDEGAYEEASLDLENDCKNLQYVENDQKLINRVLSSLAGVTGNPLATGRCLEYIHVRDLRAVQMQANESIREANASIKSQCEAQGNCNSLSPLTFSAEKPVVMYPIN